METEVHVAEGRAERPFDAHDGRARRKGLVLLADGLEGFELPAGDRRVDDDVARRCVDLDVERGEAIELADGLGRGRARRDVLGAAVAAAREAKLAPRHRARRGAEGLDAWREELGRIGELRMPRAREGGQEERREPGGRRPTSLRRGARAGAGRERGEEARHGRVTDLDVLSPSGAEAESAFDRRRSGRVEDELVPHALEHRARLAPCRGRRLARAGAALGGRVPVEDAARRGAEEREDERGGEGSHRALSDNPRCRAPPFRGTCPRVR